MRDCQYCELWQYTDKCGTLNSRKLVNLPAMYEVEHR